ADSGGGRGVGAGGGPGRVGVSGVVFRAAPAAGVRPPGLPAAASAVSRRQPLPAPSGSLPRSRATAADAAPGRPEAGAALDHRRAAARRPAGGSGRSAARVASAAAAVARRPGVADQRGLRRLGRPRPALLRRLYPPGGSRRTQGGRALPGEFSEPDRPRGGGVRRWQASGAAAGRDLARRAAAAVRLADGGAAGPE